MTDTKIAPKPLQLVSITTTEGNVLVPAEPINDWLAITPVFYMDNDGKTILDGTFQITHLPTGMAFSAEPGCIACCRNSGRMLVSLDLDWQALADATTTVERGLWTAALSADQNDKLGLSRNLEWLCDAVTCDEVDAQGNKVDPDGVPTETPAAAPITPSEVL